MYSRSTSGGNWLQPSDVRREHLAIPLPPEVLADEVLKLLADHRPLGLPQHQPLPHLLVDGKQSQRRPQHPVVALLRLLQHLQVVVELLAVEEGGAVDAGELVARRVAAPVGSGDALELERLDLAGVGHVRPAAQVGELTLPVDRDALLPALLQLVDDLVLEPLALVVQQLLRPRRRHVLAAEGELLLDDLLHLLLDLRQVFDGEALAVGELDVVVKPVVDHRADGVLHVLAVEPAQRLRHHVGGAVAHDEQPVRVAVGDDRDFVAPAQRERQVHQLPVHPPDDRGLGQAASDRLGQLSDGGAVGKIANTAVG